MYELPFSYFNICPYGFVDYIDSHVANLKLASSSTSTSMRASLQLEA